MVLQIWFGMQLSLAIIILKLLCKHKCNMIYDILLTFSLSFVHTLNPNECLVIS